MQLLFLYIYWQEREMQISSTSSEADTAVGSAPVQLKVYKNIETGPVSWNHDAGSPIERKCCYVIYLSLERQRERGKVSQLVIIQRSQRQQPRNKSKNSPEFMLMMHLMIALRGIQFQPCGNRKQQPWVRLLYIFLSDLFFSPAIQHTLFWKRKKNVCFNQTARYVSCLNAIDLIFEREREKNIFPFFFLSRPEVCCAAVVIFKSWSVVAEYPMDVWIH